MIIATALDPVSGV